MYRRLSPTGLCLMTCGLFRQVSLSFSFRREASFSSLSLDFPSLNLNWSLFKGCLCDAGLSEYGERSKISRTHRNSWDGEKWESEEIGRLFGGGIDRVRDFSSGKPKIIQVGYELVKTRGNQHKGFFPIWVFTKLPCSRAFRYSELLN